MKQEVSEYWDEEAEQIVAANDAWLSSAENDCRDHDAWATSVFDAIMEKNRMETDIASDESSEVSDASKGLAGLQEELAATDGGFGSGGGQSHLVLMSELESESDEHGGVDPHVAMPTGCPERLPPSQYAGALRRQDDCWWERKISRGSRPMTWTWVEVVAPDEGTHKIYGNLALPCARPIV